MHVNVVNVINAFSIFLALEQDDGGNTPKPPCKAVIGSAVFADFGNSHQ